jgi:hypothetical protein
METPDNLASKYSHIPGWGVDADPKNDPTYPFKHWTGADHNRLNYDRPPLQPLTMEVLHSIERPNYPAVFGETIPPSGLSGAIRRMSFKYSENRLRHWFGLILADRVNVIEGVIDDISKGRMPAVFGETGFAAAWKYDRKKTLAKLTVCTAVVVSLATYIYMRQQRSSTEE